MDGGGDKGGEKKVGGPITVVLQLDIHCEGCALKIKKSVKNFEGVESVSTDLANNKLTVIGRVDPGKIRHRVKSKTRKKVDLISPANAPKKDSAPKASSEPKKAQPDSKDQKKPDNKMPKPPAVSTVVSKIRLQDGDGGGEKKEKSGEKGGDGGGDEEGKEGGGEKKEGGKKDEGGQKQAAAAAVAPVAVEANEMEYYVPYDAYRAEMLQAPQVFSDENPNACSIM